MIKTRLLLLFSFYIILLLGLTVYSYSQIDPNLTLSANEVYQSFQRTMINLGYFNRSLSTAIFVFLICAFFFCYFFFLRLASKNGISFKNFRLLIFISAGLILFSYPAFSHDIFNYLFYPRIIILYHLSPYTYKALDFPLDPWIRFMHWTHNYYPYGPGWLILSLPFYFFGFGKFILVLLNFKLLFMACYLGTAIFIKKILNLLNPKRALFGTLFFAFNPLVLIEGMLSPHNDMVMLFFLILSVYFLTVSKKKLATVALIISAGIKFLPVIFLPIILFWKKRNWQKIIFISVILLLISLCFLIWQREPYPWYFLTLVGLVSLITENNFLKRLTIGICLGTLLRYAPFLYFGDYSAVVSTAQFWLTSIPILLSLLSLKVI